ncbi:MAG: hypothetical protein RR295_04125 [Oscillospiraceae bacterium]
MRKSGFSPPAVGGSSLLVIFAVLCLTIFALLALSTVEANGRLSLALAQSVEDYYAADCAAEEILSHLRAGEVPDGVTVQGDSYCYACPLSQTQELQVEVTLRGGDYTILRWQTVSTTDWVADDSLPVFPGE